MFLCAVLAVAYLPKKKKEVSSFTRSKVTEGVPKFKKWVKSPIGAPIEVIGMMSNTCEFF